ncbi:Fc.00g100560.m01.CDS01 [Cosmosporella sp. VM-42]
MLSIHPQEFQPQPYYVPFRPVPSHRQQPEVLFNFMNMSSPTLLQSSSPAPNGGRSQVQDASVAQALEIARESPDGASDPTISKILESALSQIWGKVQAQPDAYIMTRDEFAVFNFFQHRFTGDKTAVSARKRYWDNFRA